MSNQNKILAAITVVAIFALGGYAMQVVPYYAQKQTSTEPLSGVRVSPGDPIRGLVNASKTIIEFGDFKCPACGALNPQLINLIKNDSDIRLVWKNCPSSSHPNAKAAAEAALCAGDQGKYWEYHDLLIQNQDRPDSNLYPMLAAILKLNAKVFASCLASGAKSAQVQATIAECSESGVTELPSFFINGKQFSGTNANIIHEITVQLSK